jgi:Zn-dependent protease
VTSLAQAGVAAAFVGQTSVGFHPVRVVFYATAALIALVLHEYAHAFVATRLGDQSPRSMGRLSLGPRQHADVFGTYVFPAILLLPVLFSGRGVMFAYAKPMPLNPWSVKRQSRDTVLIQVAGPVTNLLVAAVFGIALQATCGTRVLTDFLSVVVFVNVFFAAIHVVPMPPLDGARAITPFLPPRAREVFTNLEQFAPLFILLVFFILGGFFFGFVEAIARGLLTLTPGTSCLTV